MTEGTTGLRPPPQAPEADVGSESMLPGRGPLPALLVVLALLTAASTIAVAALGHRRAALLGVAASVLLISVVVLRSTRGDSTTMLIFTSAVLLLLPARLIFDALGGAGTPATILALLAGWFWVQGVIVPSLGLARGHQPVRWAVMAYALAVVASYVAASVRALDSIEGRAADRGMVIMVASAGLALLAADGIRSRERLDALLRSLVAIGCVLALVGIVQFVTGSDPVASLSVPGLTVQESDFESITDRSSFNRVAGTTLHPIEFSAVLTMLLPLALHYTFAAPPGRRRRYWLAVAIIAGAIPMSVSRTGTVGLVAVGVILFPTWTGPRRRQAIAAASVFTVLMKVLVPGLLGTIRALFLSLGVDPSVTARRIDYGYVTAFISESPVLGRGFGTFLPDRYDFLDNQFLLSLVETGAVGLLTLLLVFGVAIGAARAARRRSSDPVTRDLAQSLTASLAVAVITCGTFDFLSFPTARGVAFLLVGCAGALWRVQKEERAGTTAEAGDAGRAEELVPG